MADPAPDILDIPSEHPQPPSPSPLPSTTAPTTTTATPGPAPPASPSKRQVSMSLHPPAQIPLHHYESQPVLKPASPEMPPGLGQNDDRARWLGTASTRTSFTRVDLTRAPTPSEDDSAPGTGNGAAGSVAEVEGGAGAGEGVQAEQEEEEEEVAKEEEVAVPQTPQTLLTFLLVSGRRRTMSFEPETTVGRVKELVWNTWPSGEPRRLHHL
ncbi:hypothetical protein PUNSTDRAFT_120375 [Punctularia strigosozonata HHB-11173 SS5]|uniref:uncharacterized protein n=1 Tax=Punctularia strigosozonata (strain HHB-11173) TaxID=741275 RepID=UPI0004416761|nr:uncharacterized protein PUNSTDRAFT_120375 [Punctularia strigosozonata HHB-11173 SS5]EIN08807.1 hypothetical protein PUNSTDRAFT_120375 [Punctularia strigosozonata HHB-11173 SS5]